MEFEHYKRQAQRFSNDQFQPLDKSILDTIDDNPYDMSFHEPIKGMGATQPMPRIDVASENNLKQTVEPPSMSVDSIDLSSVHNSAYGNYEFKPEKPHPADLESIGFSNRKEGQSTRRKHKEKNRGQIRKIQTSKTTVLPSRGDPLNKTIESTMYDD